MKPICVSLLLLAFGLGESIAAPRTHIAPPEFVPEYPYSNAPQYQYPIMDGRAVKHACPKGQKVFQGKCRIARSVVVP